MNKTVLNILAAIGALGLVVAVIASVTGGNITLPKGLEV